MDEGWIKLHRKLQHSEIWNSEKFTKGQAWIDMLMMANHKDGMFFLRGNEVHVKKGQIARAERTFCKKWKWSRGKVRRFFLWLETRQQIIQQKSRLISIVTILKYNQYQENKTTDSTTDGPQTVQQTDQNKNVKNDKNKKEVKDIYLNDVRFTKPEYEKLKAKFGSEERLTQGIEILNNYKMAKGKKYKSDYHAMLNWVVERVNKDGRQRDCDPDVENFLRDMGKEDNTGTPEGLPDEP